MGGEQLTMADKTGTKQVEIYIEDKRKKHLCAFVVNVRQRYRLPFCGTGPTVWFDKG